MSNAMATTTTTTAGSSKRKRRRKHAGSTAHNIAVTMHGSDVPMYRQHGILISNYPDPIPLFI